MRVQDSESRLGAGRQAGGWASRRGNSPAWGMHVMRARGEGGGGERRGEKTHAGDSKKRRAKKKKKKKKKKKIPQKSSSRCPR